MSGSSDSPLATRCRRKATGVQDGDHLVEGGLGTSCIQRAPIPDRRRPKQPIRACPFCSRRRAASSVAVALRLAECSRRSRLSARIAADACRNSAAACRRFAVVSTRASRYTGSIGESQTVMPRPSAPSCTPIVCPSKKDAGALRQMALQRILFDGARPLEPDGHVPRLSERGDVRPKLTAVLYRFNRLLKDLFALSPHLVLSLAGGARSACGATQYGGCRHEGEPSVSTLGKLARLMTDYLSQFAARTGNPNAPAASTDTPGLPAHWLSTRAKSAKWEDRR